jgi:hypothetical protein
MTTRQQIGLYFPAWGKAAANHGWNRRGVGQRVDFFGNSPELNALYQRIWQVAEDRARAEGAIGPCGAHFRHACHVVALGADKSSTQLTNAELDRILALFKLLADPDDLSATLAWNNPQEEKRKRMLWWIQNNCVESYVVEVCRQKFQTDDLESLNFKQLGQLHMTLKNRENAHLKNAERELKKLEAVANAVAAFVNVARNQEEPQPL